MNSLIVEIFFKKHKFSIFSGHNGDVLDLAWGPGDVVLATASVDNNIIIWNAERMPEQITILRGHTSLVKGVFFDPVGKYLASQSDDKTMRVWKTSDWSLEAVVDAPFQESGKDNFSTIQRSFY